MKHRMITNRYFRYKESDYKFQGGIEGNKGKYMVCEVGLIMSLEFKKVETRKRVQLERE